MQQSELFTKTLKTLYTSLRQLGRVPLLLLCCWLATLWWGERTVFSRSAAACDWAQWESWPSNARPHHVLLIADPQLVDPHTYPDRPWPLSSLTIWITDLYLRRTYGHLLDHLNPHTTLFLGDLFDGGREWATGDFVSPELRYQRYGAGFWIQEYNRFMKLFVKRWHDYELHTIPSSEGRRIITSLPGNHDLGFATGIDLSVRRRFDAYFGPLNRVDMVGNHTFISVDTVSLSAMDQIDPVTGSSGVGDGTGPDTKITQIWKPVKTFLENVQALKSKAILEHSHQLHSIARGINPLTTDQLLDHNLKAMEWSASAAPNDQKMNYRVAVSQYPTVLLSHVPLYRSQDVSCGPLRERGSSIPLSAGYQYQNVLTPLISSDLVKSLDAKQITQIYSGDDHDYCEIEHGEFTGRIREITVKSASMAMGIRRPGVQLASLWNPIDIDSIVDGDPDAPTPKDTIQNHLCLLPFMEGIIIRYAQVLIATLIILTIRAIRHDPQRHHNSTSHQDSHDQKSKTLLPLSRKYTPPSSPRISPSDQVTNPFARSRRTSTSTAHNGHGIKTHMTWSVHSRSGSLVKPLPTDATETDDWGYPLTPNGYNYQISASPSYLSSITSSWLVDMGGFHIGKWTSEFVKTHLGHRPTKGGEFMRSLYLVAVPTLSFYAWLLWRDR